MTEKQNDLQSAKAALALCFDALGTTALIDTFVQIYDAGPDGVRPGEIESDATQSATFQRIKKLSESGLVEKARISTPGLPGRAVNLTVPRGGFAEEIAKFILHHTT